MDKVILSFHADFLATSPHLPRLARWFGCGRHKEGGDGAHAELSEVDGDVAASSKFSMGTYYHKDISSIHDPSLLSLLGQNFPWDECESRLALCWIPSSPSMSQHTRHTPSVVYSEHQHRRVSQELMHEQTFWSANPAIKAPCTRRRLQFRCSPLCR